MPSRTRLRRAAVAALVLPAIFGAPTALAVGPSPTTADPAAPGLYGFQRAEYNLPTKVTVGVNAYTNPTVTPAARVDAALLTTMRLAGDVYYPSNGAGPFPVLVFMHGNHATCQSGPGSSLGLLVDPLSGTADYQNGGCSAGNPTADALLAIDEARSYQGYDYLAERLATQGYIVASMDVNDITEWSNNANESGYLGRAEAMSKTLDLVNSWNTTTGPTGIGNGLKGRVDISRVGVMGHSRGGEGVNQFAEYNLTRPANATEAAARVDPEKTGKPQPVPDFGPRYNLKGVFSLAPVDNQGARKPVVSGTNFATLLPYCDGDVYDLEGAPVYERSKNGLAAGGFIAAQYLINGANHDYFNTVWTEDDANLFGFGDPYCNAASGPTRLQPAEERQIGLTVIDGFLRATVGGEHQFDPIVRGESLPPAACPNAGEDPATGPTCRNVVQTSYAAPNRRELLVAQAGAVAAPKTTPGGDPITLAGFTLTPCTAAAGTLLVTTGCGASPNRSYGPQFTLAWNAVSSLTVTPLAANRDISAFSTLNFRASENYTAPQQLPAEDVIRVTLTDQAGHTASVLSSKYSAALEPEPGTSARKQVLDGVRIPLNAFTGVDLTTIKTIVLGAGVDTLTGSIQFNDLALQEPAFVPGPDPATGTPGAPGPAGQPGAQGNPGPAGQPGAQGNPGPAGQPGAQGDPGAAGQTGAQGAAGQTGSQGDPGAAGQTGAQGDPGAAGQTGAQGDPGAAGQAGAQGDPGTTGATGDPGAPGAQGPPGTQGQTGAQGDAGTPGAAGQNGSSGTSGTSRHRNCRTIVFRLDRAAVAKAVSKGLRVRSTCRTRRTLTLTVSLSARSARRAGLTDRTLTRTTLTLSPRERARVKLTQTGALLALGHVTFLVRTTRTKAAR